MPRQPKPPRLVQDKDTGIYYIAWSKPSKTGKLRSARHSTGTRNHAEACEVLAGFAQGKEEVDNTSTISALLDHYYNQHVLPNVTDKDRQLEIATHLHKAFGDTNPSSLTSAHVITYTNSRTSGRFNGREVATSTVRRELGMLSAAYNLALKDQLIDRVPHIPLPATGEPRDLWLTEEQCEQWLEWCDPLQGHARAYRYSLVRLMTASRGTAVLNLQWKHVDLDAGVIDFRKAMKTTTNKRRVPIPINDRLKENLLIWKEMDEAEPDDYVLGSNRGIRGQWTRVKERAMKESSDPVWEKIIPYTLRHTWATLAARRGVGIEKIAVALGDDIKTVWKNYIHHCPGYLKGAM